MPKPAATSTPVRSELSDIVCEIMRMDLEALRVRTGLKAAAPCPDKVRRDMALLFTSAVLGAVGNKALAKLREAGVVTVEVPSCPHEPPCGYCPPYWRRDD